jgi:hypothetical protein
MHCSAMGVLVGTDAAELDTLHRCRSRGAPLRGLWWGLHLRWWRLLLLQRWENIVCGSGGVAMLLCQYACHAPVHVWAVGIETTEAIPDRCQLIAQ